jgi:ADP-ribose pyrophosphatase YjhB (NUDIX family)
VAVGAVVLTGANEVVLVRRGREPFKGQWSVPGGALELGETLQAAAVREVLEETGLIVDPLEPVAILDEIVSDESGRVRFHYVIVDYACRVQAGTPVAGADVDEVAVVQASDLGRYALSPRVRDALARGFATPGGPTRKDP